MARSARQQRGFIRSDDRFRGQPKAANPAMHSVRTVQGRQCIGTTLREETGSAQIFSTEFSLWKIRPAEFFLRQEDICTACVPGPSSFFPLKMPAVEKNYRADLRRWVTPELSIKKVTENLQNPPLIYLTEFGAVPITGGQGSGHPHPVVVDNVLGSCGNLMSPAAFCRL